MGYFAHSPMFRVRQFSSAFVAVALCLNGFAASHLEAVKTIQEYCVDCHDGTSKKGDLDLESLLRKDVTANSEVWEKAIRKMQARQMPPMGKRRPGDMEYHETVA